MAVPLVSRVGGHVVVYCLDVLYSAVPPAMVVASLLPGIVSIGIASVAGQDVVEIKDGYVVVSIAIQPVIDEPVVEGTGISRMGGVGVILSLWGRGNNDEELVLSGRKVGQEIFVDSLGVGYGVVL